MECDELTNSGDAQKLRVAPGAFHLLRYWTCAAPRNLLVQMVSPAKRLFAAEHHSYCPILTPLRTWTQQRVLIRPQTGEVQLKLPAAFVGRAGVGGIELRQMRLDPFADLAEPTQALDLYLVLRGGHRLPTVTDELIENRTADRSVTVADLAAEALPLNPVAAAAKDAGIRAWTIAPDLPLKAELLRRTAPSSSFLSRSRSCP